jgi:hypothetical protein
VRRFPARCPEHRHPVGREVHVHQQLHAGCRGSSTSSARQAAYFSACVMSSASR